MHAIMRVLIALLLTLSTGAAAAQTSLPNCSRLELMSTPKLVAYLGQKFGETDLLWAHVVPISRIFRYASLAFRARTPPIESNVVEVVYRNRATGSWTGIASFDTGVSCVAVSDRQFTRLTPERDPDDEEDGEYRLNEPRHYFDAVIRSEE